MIKLELTENEAQSFKMWRKHQDNFELLLLNNIFEIKNGNAEIHFDWEGNIHNIKAHLNIFRKGSKVVPTVILTKLQ